MGAAAAPYAVLDTVEYLKARRADRPRPGAAWRDPERQADAISVRDGVVNTGRAGAQSFGRRCAGSSTWSPPEARSSALAFSRAAGPRCSTSSSRCSKSACRSWRSSVARVGIVLGTHAIPGVFRACCLMRSSTPPVSPEGRERAQDTRGRAARRLPRSDRRRRASASSSTTGAVASRRDRPIRRNRISRVRSSPPWAATPNLPSLRAGASWTRRSACSVTLAPAAQPHPRKVFLSGAKDLSSLAWKPRVLRSAQEHLNKRNTPVKFRLTRATLAPLRPPPQRTLLWTR